MKRLFIFLLLFSLYSNTSSVFASDSTVIYLDSASTKRLSYNFDKAKNFVSLSIKFQKRSDSNSKLGNSYFELGHIYKSEGLMDSSLYFYDLALQDILFSSNLDNSAYIFLQKGRIYKIQSNYSKALNNLKKSLIIYKQLGDSINTGIVNLNIGNVFKGLNKTENALNYYRGALHIFEAHNDVQKIGSCYNNIGNLYKNAQQYDSAFYYLYKTLDIRKKSNNMRHISFAYHNLANLHLDLQSPDSSLYYINKSLKLKFELNNNYQIFLDYYTLGDIYAMKNDLENSKYYYKKALKWSAIQNDFSSSAELNKILGDIYYFENNNNIAATYYYRYTVFNDSLKIVKNYFEIESELISYEFVKDSINKEQLLLQKEISEIEKNNIELNSKINKNNTKYLFIILGLVLLLGGLLFISFKKRLSESNSHKKILEDQNEELKRTLISKEEKETLLKEVHHRVKNNLQIINSLIRLQSHYMTEENFHEKVTETENRIRSMALVHEKLYKSEQLSKLSADIYIKELTANILESFESETPIFISYDIENIQFSIDTLIPLGLIINEVLSNSIKYAFTGRNKGKIVIRLNRKSNGKQIQFDISDNGMGADISFEELSEDSLGMELITSLCEQLDGEIKLNTDKGFEYFFTFPDLK